jgi:hypothetical protein
MVEVVRMDEYDSYTGFNCMHYIYVHYTLPSSCNIELVLKSPAVHWPRLVRSRFHSTVVESETLGTLPLLPAFFFQHTSDTVPYGASSH